MASVLRIFIAKHLVCFDNVIETPRNTNGQSTLKVQLSQHMSYGRQSPWTDQDALTIQPMRNLAHLIHST